MDWEGEKKGFEDIHQAITAVIIRTFTILQKFPLTIAEYNQPNILSGKSLIENLYFTAIASISTIASPANPTTTHARIGCFLENCAP